MTKRKLKAFANKSLTRVDKIKIWFSIVFRLLLIATGIYAGIRLDWIDLMLSVITLFLTFLPSIIEKRYRIDFPSEFEILVLFFIFGSILLGEFSLFYEKFWWWDVMLHTLSGIIFGIIGFALVYILNRDIDGKFDLSPFFVGLFAVCFAITLGVFWEIFEYSMDYFFNLNMQKSGLVDTMWDLIVDSVGAIIIAVLGVCWMKSDVNFFEFLENKLLLKDGHKPT